MLLLEENLEEKLSSKKEELKLLRYYANFYKLKLSQADTILETYSQMLHVINRGQWEIPRKRRKYSRIPYNNILECGSGNIQTGFISIEAQKIIDDKRKDNNYHLTWDHIYSPQTYSYYMYSNWYEIYNNNLHNFFKDMKMLMKVVRVLKKENTNFREYTINNESTSYQLKLKVPTTHRYTAAGIILLGDNISPRTIRSEDIPNRYPWELSEHYIEWEAECMIMLSKDEIKKLKKVYGGS